jgi:hypothetical protein
MLTVQPAGRSDATFLLPPGCRFVQAMIDGAAAPCAPVGLRAWKIDAPSDLLPYRLTLVYDTLLAVKGKAAHEVRFLAPRISGMEIQQSLWSIKLDGADSSLDETRAYISGRVAETCDSAHAALARLEASVRALEDVSAAQGTNLPSTVIAENFWRWQYAVNLDHERLLHAAGSSDLAIPLASKLSELTEKAARVRQRLIQAGIVDELELPPAGVAPTVGEAAAAIRLTTSGAAEDLRISWPVKRSVPSPRMAAALGLALFALLLGSFERNGAVRSWLLAHSHLAVAAMAVGWWLMAPFGWLGWPVLLAAVWLSLCSPVRGPRAGHQSALVFASKGSARARRAIAD